MTSPAVMLSTAVLLLIASCGLVPAEETLATCTETREAFTARTAHPVSVTPAVPISGQFLQLCPETIDTCCNSFMESAFENSTLDALAQYLPPSFVTTMLDSIENVVNSNYDLVDDDVDKAAMIILSNVSGISSVVGRQLTELTDAMKLLHGDGTAVDLLDILKRFFAHQILLQMRNELPLTTVSEEVTACVAEKIISEPLASTLADISAKLTQQLNTVFDIREIIIDLYHLAINLELESIPFTECVRSYAELHYCQVCVPLPGYAASRPCHNVCRNVMIGCSAFLHQYREAVKTKASEALALLEVVQMDSNGYQQAVNRVGEELQRLAESIEGQGANIIAQVSTCTTARRRRRQPAQQRHRRQVSGAVDDASQALGLPVALAQDLFNKVFVELETSHFFRFDSLSTDIADGLCSSLPTSNCWNQENVGTDSASVVSPGNEALGDNPDLQPKGDTDIRNKTSFIDDFLSPEIDEIMPRPGATVVQHYTRGALIMAVLVAMAMMF